MIKAVFLDRDGVINDNSNHYYICSIEQWRFNSDVIEALTILVNNGFKLFIVSNQGGIAKGICEIEKLDELHNWLVHSLALKGVDIEEIVYCPHHHDVGNCLCRKPKSLLLERLIASHKIDVSSSFLIGDSDRDIEAGNQLGIDSIKIDSNSSILSLCKQLVKSHE